MFSHTHTDTHRHLYADIIFLIPAKLSHEERCALFIHIYIVYVCTYHIHITYYSFLPTFFFPFPFFVSFRRRRRIVQVQYDARVYRGTGNRVLSTKALLTVDGFVKKRKKKKGRRERQIVSNDFSLPLRARSSSLRFTKSECSCLYSKGGISRLGLQKCTPNLSDLCRLGKKRFAEANPLSIAI